MGQAVLIGQKAAHFEPAMLWLSTGYRLASTRLGVTVGTPSVRIAAPRSPGATVVSAYASYRGDGLEMSAESATWPRGHTFFAFRVSQRHSPRWSVRYYHAAKFSAGTNPAVDPMPNGDVLRGAVADYQAPQDFTVEFDVLIDGSVTSTSSVLGVDLKRNGTGTSVGMLALSFSNMRMTLVSYDNTNPTESADFYNAWRIYGTLKPISSCGGL